MKFRLTRPVALLSALALAGAGVLAAKGFIRHEEGSLPVVFEVVPANPGPNTQVTITVELDAVSPLGQIVTIGSTDPQAFLDLPSEVVIPAGESSCTFQANTSNVYTRWTVLAATSNGGTALAIQP
jgi:hypothetical protein